MQTRKKTPYWERRGKMERGPGKLFLTGQLASIGHRHSYQEMKTKHWLKGEKKQHVKRWQRQASHASPRLHESKTTVCVIIRFYLMFSLANYTCRQKLKLANITTRKILEFWITIKPMSEINHIRFLWWKYSANGWSGACTSPPPQKKIISPLISNCMHCNLSLNASRHVAVHGIFDRLRLMFLYILANVKSRRSAPTEDIKHDTFQRRD